MNVPRTNGRALTNQSVGRGLTKPGKVHLEKDIGWDLRDVARNLVKNRSFLPRLHFLARKTCLLHSSTLL